MIEDRDLKQETIPFNAVAAIQTGDVERLKTLLRAAAELKLDLKAAFGDPSGSNQLVAKACQQEQFEILKLLVENGFPLKNIPLQTVRAAEQRGYYNLAIHLRQHVVPLSRLPGW